MARSDSNDRYVKGERPELDKGFEEYQKLRFWSGEAYSAALSSEEVDLMIKLWKKETVRPWELSTNDVIQIVVVLTLQ